MQFVESVESVEPVASVESVVSILERIHYLAGVMPQRMLIPLRLREHSLLTHPAAPLLHATQVVSIKVGDGPPSRGCDHCPPKTYLVDAPAMPEMSPPSIALPAVRLDAAEVRKRFHSLRGWYALMDQVSGLKFDP